jgi:uncharacterized membrane protein (UPF0127 family)
MLTKQSIHILRATGFWQRFRGLMWTNALPSEQALLIQHCNSVHTFFMRFPLDVVYLNKQMQIVKLQGNVPPWRMSWGGVDAHHTLEMAAGGIDRFKLHIGGTID